MERKPSKRLMENTSVARVLITGIDMQGSYEFSKGPMILLKMSYRESVQATFSRDALLQMNYSHFCGGGIPDIERGVWYDVFFDDSGYQNQIVRIEPCKAE